MLEHFLSAHSFPLSMLLLSNSLALSYSQHRYTPNWALLFFHKVKVYLDFPLSTNFLAHFSLLHMRPFFWGGLIFLLPELKLWLSYSETALVANSRFLVIRVSFSHPHFQLSMWIRFNFFSFSQHSAEFSLFSGSHGCCWQSCFWLVILCMVRSSIYFFPAFSDHCVSALKFSIVSLDISLFFF